MSATATLPSPAAAPAIPLAPAWMPPVRTPLEVRTATVAEYRDIPGIEITRGVTTAGAVADAITDRLERATLSQHFEWHGFSVIPGLTRRCVIPRGARFIVEAKHGGCEGYVLNVYLKRISPTAKHVDEPEIVQLLWAGKILSDRMTILSCQMLVQDVLDQ